MKCTKPPQVNSIETKQESLQWIFIAKGIGIILVVIGYFYPTGSPAYWKGLNNIIYSFHMPLFFIISGYLYNHTKYSYSTLIKNKIKRLLYPFITIAIVFLFIKYISGLFVNLGHPVGLLSIYALFVDPVHSYMPLLWYLQALFIIFAIYPLIRNLVKNNYLILLLFLFVNMIFGVNHPVIGNAFANMPFFVAGMVLKENWTGTLLAKIKDATLIYTVAPALIFALIYSFFKANFFESYAYSVNFLLGMLGSLFVINLSHTIDIMHNKGFKKKIAMIGYYAMSIFLFHTFFESAIRIGCIQVLNFVQIQFEVIAIIAIVAGVIFPLQFEKFILRKNKITKKLVLGLVQAS